MVLGACRGNDSMHKGATVWAVGRRRQDSQGEKEGREVGQGEGER